MTRGEVNRICREARKRSEPPNLRGVNLRGANLREADLTGADLRGANLREADLSWIDLTGANLCGANLRFADLYGVNLRGASMRGANLRGAKHILRVGPGGSRGDDLYVVRHDSGPMLLVGCRWCDLDTFVAAVEKDHGGDQHGLYYRAVADLIRVWYALEESEE
jgi:hypothetical protein